MHASTRTWLLAVVGMSAGCRPLIGVRSLGTARAGATTYHAMPVGGRTRSYLLHLPPAAARGPVPLVLVFHGHHGSGAVAMETSGMNGLADRLGVAVAYPDGTGRLPGVLLAWNAATCCGYAHTHGVDDIAFADAIVDTLSARGLVAPHAVFAAGFSAGGMLALRLACERADRFRAVADLAGAMPDTTCAPSRRIAVLFVRGARDDDLRIDHARQADRRTGVHAYATSSEGALRFWSSANGCTGLDTVAAASVVTLVRASGCAPGGDTELVTIADHPHAWPGGKASWLLAQQPSDRVHGSALVLAFFARQLRAP